MNVHNSKACKPLSSEKFIYGMTALRFDGQGERRGVSPTWIQGPGFWSSVRGECGRGLYE
jgi:hypothetical protein